METLSVQDALTDREQALLHGQRRAFTVGIDADLAHLVFHRHYRKRGNVRGIEELPDIIRGDLRNRRYDIALLLLGKALVLELLTPFVAEAVEGFVEILLDILIAAEHRTDLVDTAGKLVLDHIAVDGKRVYARLHEEQFGLEHLFEHLATHAPVGRQALGAHHLHLRLDVGERYHFVAHDGDGLVYQTSFISLREGRGAAARQCGGGRQHDDCLSHLSE